MNDEIGNKPASGSDVPWPMRGREQVVLDAPEQSNAETADVPFDSAEDIQSGEPQPWVVGGAGSGESGNSGTRLMMMLVAVAAGTYFLGPYVFLVIGALLISVILHEYGHYWTAKRCGMKVTEFFVGFGPRLWSFRRGETDYGFKPIVAGAYVKIIGMNNLEEVDPADEPRTYRRQSTPKRIAVVVAGPAMNILIAFVLFMGIFLVYGKPDPSSWTVRGVQPGTAAAQANLLPGDRVLSIAGQSIGSFADFRAQIDEKAGQTVDLVVDRGGENLKLSTTLGWRLNAAAAAAIPSKPGLLTADQVLSVDDKSVTTYAQFRGLLAEPGPPALLKIERSDHPYELIVARPLPLPETGANGFLGVRPEVSMVRESAIGALGETGRTFGLLIGGMGQGIVHIFSPAGLSSLANQVATSTSAPPDRAVEPNVLTPVDGGPTPSQLGMDPDDQRPISIIGIVRGGSDVLEADIEMFIFMFAMVNLILALLNLVPLLPFDGGHAAIALYEGIRGAIRGAPYRADITKMLPVVYAVFALLFVLSATTMFLDIVRPISFTP